MTLVTACAAIVLGLHSHFFEGAIENAMFDIRLVLYVLFAIAVVATLWRSLLSRPAKQYKAANN